MQDVLMIRRGRAGAISAVMFSVAVCLAGLWWTVAEWPKTKEENPDSAGVLALLPSLVGMVIGGWGSWAGVRALREQRTASMIAEEFARSVADAEGTQYKQLLGSGQAAPDGRIDLAFTATATGVDGSRPGGTLEEIADFYRGLRPGRMVITGTPSSDRDGQDGRTAGDAGTGKTVLALSLILGLAKERSPQDPVPVRLTAASWPGSDIRAWLRTHLIDVYSLRRRDAARLVNANLVLPVIDGLDEMDPGTTPGYGSRAAQLLRRVAEFEYGGAHCPVVVTCRHVHYQALVEAEAEPRIVAHIAVARVDAARAHSYLSQSVAGTERSRTRWHPVLSALDAVAAGPVGTALPEHILLAETLDTPWRLTLAATVFQERIADGRYLRHPADLLVLAANGRLYEYLLDHYIGASVAAPHRGADDTCQPSPTDTPPRLDAEATWRRLAVLARYLNGNSGSEDGSPRRVAGRVLSSTDLVLHELWPLSGKHRTRWTERILAGATPLLFFFGLSWLLEIYSFGAMEILMCISFLCFAVVLRPVWPKPARISLDRLRTPVGRRAFTRGFTIGFAISSLLLFGLYKVADGEFELQEGLENCLSFGLAVGIAVGLARGLTIKQEYAKGVPRYLIRMDLIAAVVFGPVAAAGVMLMFGLMGTLALHFASNGPGLSDTWVTDILKVPLTFGLVIGGFIFSFPAAGGPASLRYLAFLLHMHRKLPWRLGRFLDACYELGILRVSGTAWQFRHRELQDHLATRPAPPFRSGPPPHS
ncbi:NACHT domain-containing protein [Streptomyces anulatus]|uniref:NACHT domain-containing protein n=1 Tax=Streptomyces anulatus TaxID=1892 RepID=UPI003636D707